MSCVHIHVPHTLCWVLRNLYSYVKLHILHTYPTYESSLWCSCMYIQRDLGTFDGAKWWYFGTPERYRPPPCKLLRALSELNVSCFTKYLKRSETWPRFFCAYLHGMYDFTRLTRAIVCGEIDLCWNFESGFRRRISKKKNHDCIVVWWKNIFFRKEKLKCTTTTANVIKW